MASLLCVAVFAASAKAEEPVVSSEQQLHHWLFYANPEVGVYAHTGKGNSSSTTLTGPRVRRPKPFPFDLGVTISEPERSRETIASAIVGGTIGLLTPAIDIPSRPRFFLDFSVFDALTTEAQLARRGNPGVLGFPRVSGTPSTPFGEGALTGIGTQIGVQHQGPQLYAGFGPSFEIPLGSNQLVRFKPAVVYSRTRTDIYAQTRRGVRLNDDRGAQQTLDDFRFILLEEKRKEIYHAAGPALEVEYLPGIDWGPASLSVFLKGHAAHIFNDPKTEMRQCNTAGGQPEECALWKYTQDTWTYRAVTGVRIQWSPQSSR